MKYEKLMSLKEFGEAKLIGGREGLERDITGAHIIEMADGSNWNKRGELIFTSGVGFHDVDKDLRWLFDTIVRNQAAGFVVEIGPYVSEIPSELVEEADRRSIPLFTIPFSVPITAIIAQIYYHVYRQHEYHSSIEQMLSDVIHIGSEEIYEKVRKHNFNENLPHVTMYLESNMTDLEEGIDIIKKSVHNVFTMDSDTLYCRENNGIVVILKLPEKKYDIHKFIENLRQQIQKIAMTMIADIRINAGVGNTFFKLSEINESIQHARQAMDMLHKCRREDSHRIYSEMGIYQLLFEVENNDTFLKIVKSQLGALIDYDSENATELLDTYQVYLEEGQNITLTAERLYLHRNTVKYRIGRIREITGKTLTDVNDLFHDRLAFKILRFLGEK